MGLFDRMKEPLFLKENSDAEVQLEKLRTIQPLLNAEGQTKLRQDIKCLEYGIAGEKNIAFELKNSHMPMYILHDIYLEDGDLSAQIDYLVFTKKLCFIIECKNLYGDIEINNMGNFIRTIEFAGRKKKEGIYSPITQNQRHLELLKKIKIDKKSNVLTKFMTGRYFEDFHKSIVVLANPKTVLTAKYAKKEDKERVIRADQLVNYIKEVYKKSKEAESSDEKLLSWAQSYMNLHQEIEKNYTEKYEPYMTKKEGNICIDDKLEVDLFVKRDNITTEVKVEETEIFKELRAYRLQKSREENIKPYYIYNDNQLKDLIKKMPETESQLQMVAGFGEVKVQKYGKDIMEIIKKY